MQFTKDGVRFFISAQVKAGQSFTAYDITKDMRSSCGQHFPHAGGVREVVHELFESGDLIFANYDRELDYSLGISPPPWRYYPDFQPSSTPSTQPAIVHRTWPKVLVATSKLDRPLCPTCHKPMNKKGFGLYQTQRYRCLTCGTQTSEFAGSVFHNRKHRPAIILDALWCIAHGKTDTYAANAVKVNRKTVANWRKVTNETWDISSGLIQSLEQRFNSAKLDKLKAAL